jgi:hypothetical protein
MAARAWHKPEKARTAAMAGLGHIACGRRVNINKPAIGRYIDRYRRSKQGGALETPFKRGRFPSRPLDGKAEMEQRK